MRLLLALLLAGRCPERPRGYHYHDIPPGSPDTPLVRPGPEVSQRA